MTEKDAVLPHILVVDDDRLVLASLARGLRQAGYRVTEASCGEDARCSKSRLFYFVVHSISPSPCKH